MATKRISALTAASAAALTDQIPIEDNTNATKKVTAAQFAALLVTGSTINAALGYTAANAAALSATALTAGTVPLDRLSGITATQIAAGAAIADTQLATISTTGKVANSATTATAANTASAIVARDGDGDIAIRDLAARDIAATTLAGDGSAVTDLDADELTAGTVATARLGEGNAHEYAGLAALGSMWLGAPPVSLAIARSGAGLATSVTVNGIALTVTRPSAVITRLGGLVTAPAFARASVANNPETGASASSGAVRYVRGKNLLTSAQSRCQDDGSSAFTQGYYLVNTSTIAFDSTKAYEGSWSIKVIGDGALPNKGVELHPDSWPLLEIGDVITFSAYVWAPVGETVRLLAASTVITAHGWSADIVGNGAWQRATLSFTAPAGGHYSFAARIPGSAVFDFWVDAWQVEYAASATAWVEGGDRAILAERAATNLMNAGCETFTKSGPCWTEYESASVTVTGSQADPFGGTAAYRLQSGGGTSALKFLAGGGVGTDGLYYSGQIWLRNLDTGNTVEINSNQGGLSVVVDADEGWVLVRLEAALSNGSGGLHIQMRTASAGTDLDVVAMWPQWELGATCTSYIAPGTTRAAEGLALPAVCNPPEGTVIVRAYVTAARAAGSATGAGVLVDAWQGSTQNRLFLAYSSGAWVATGYGPTVGDQLDGASWASSLSEGWHTIAMTWADGVIVLWVDGTKRDTSDYNDNFPTAFPATAIGSSGYAAADHWDDVIEAVHVYDRALPDATMAALTAAGAAELPAHPAETFRQTYAGSLGYTARVVDVTSSGGLVTAASRASAAIAV